MNFKQTFEAMKNGAKVKLPSWGGYWCWDGQTILMHTKDGAVLDIRDTQVVEYTMTKEDYEKIGGHMNHIKNVEDFPEYQKH